MRLTITKCILVGLIAQACSLDDQEWIEVQMFGIAEKPENATGDRDPSFQDWKLRDVHLIPDEGDSQDTSYGEEGLAFKIIDRPQIIFKQSLNDYAGKSFTSLELVFAPEVQGGDAKASELNFVLTNPTLILAGPIAIKKARTTKVQVKLLWSDTVGDELMQEPQVDIKIVP